MFVVINNIPSTFFSDKPVKVLDEDKNLFYIHPNKEGSIKFNLPVGKYHTGERIFREKYFEPYSLNFKGFPKGFMEGFKVSVCNNPNKATIFPKQKHIFLDKEIANHKYQPLKVFTLGHEISHCLPEGRGIRCNSGEFNWCDQNSANYMLSVGYNPSQIKLAHRILLDGGHRTECFENHINKFKRR